MPFGNYTVSSDVRTPGESDLLDNTIIDGWLVVTLTGDVDGDCDVDQEDVFDYVVPAYGTRMGDAAYHPNSDFDGDSDVDPIDVFRYMAPNYGNSGC